MLPLLLPTAAGAGPEPDGFDHVRDTAGCSISMRPESHPQGAAMRAICSWPEVEPVRFGGLIQDYDRYSEFLFPISVSRTERQEGERALVYQRQRVPGIADREVLLWMSASALPEGGVRVSWTTASEVPLPLDRGTVRTPKNEGFWQVSPQPAGGSHVVHEIALDAGGSVPRWLVNLVRSTGFARLMQQVRTFAASMGA